MPRDPELPSAGSMQAPAGKGDQRTQANHAKAEQLGIRIKAVEQPVLPQAAPPHDGLRRQRVGPANPGQVQVALHEGAFAQAYAHAASSLNEVGGALLGKAYQWEGQTFVEISASLPARMVQAGPAHVTFTPETWTDLIVRKDRAHPEAQIVGWYHSHPRMGIFLSGMDLSIHEGFFALPWQVALVLNAQDGKGGFFVWHNQEIVPASGFDFVEEALAAGAAAADGVVGAGRPATGLFAVRTVPVIPTAPQPPAATPAGGAEPADTGNATRGHVAPPAAPANVASAKPARGPAQLGLLSAAAAGAALVVLFLVRRQASK